MCFCFVFLDNHVWVMGEQGFKMGVRIADCEWIDGVCVCVCVYDCESYAITWYNHVSFVISGYILPHDNGTSEARECDYHLTKSLCKHPSVVQRSRIYIPSHLPMISALKILFDANRRAPCKTRASQSTPYDSARRWTPRAITANILIWIDSIS